MGVDAKDLVDALTQTNGNTVYVPEAVAFDFVDSCRKRRLRVKCTMVFGGQGVVKITMPNK